LNLDLIKQIAAARGFIIPEDEYSAEELANLIFQSRPTTANKLSGISDRSAGMEAVRKFVEKSQENIFISIEEKHPNQSPVPFKVII